MKLAGAFFFRYRNMLGPLLFLAALGLARPIDSPGDGPAPALLGIAVALLGQGLRNLTIG